MTLFDADVPSPAAPTGPLVRVRMTLAYDGGPFHGFAPQRGVPTVAGAVSSALERVLRLAPPPVLTCAGRTDRGVHAWGQVLHVDLPAEHVGGEDDLASLQRRLLKLLAPNIVVRALIGAPADWDARRSACWRRYRYAVLNRSVPDPFLHARAWHVAEPLDLRAMQLACDPLIGEHDFSSFCRRPTEDAPAPGAEPASLVRRVLDARWHAGEGAPVPLGLDDPGDGEGLLMFEIRATAFCHQMVRSVVGTLVEVGAGRRRAGTISALLRAKDRSAAGVVAPPHGLYLWEVGYPGG